MFGIVFLHVPPLSPWILSPLAAEFFIVYKQTIKPPHITGPDAVNTLVCLCPE